eukprot:gnl/MRDRNA2_/MRDRNA2_81050_c0_seq1.p1 gnl/MRDRNA2_/MRDRNA2_81050_c0~~gnl/MRDRNA2_/MRDRNA2_81050_c0_seq1.p1  ORF type:complete len:341 (+),score=50.09 gnl/MRDRNA2_/MRDRNA2_81050_c0_seq1:57-1025(+)
MTGLYSNLLSSTSRYVPQEDDSTKQASSHSAHIWAKIVTLGVLVLFLQLALHAKSVNKSTEDQHQIGGEIQIKSALNLLNNIQIRRARNEFSIGSDMRQVSRPSLDRQGVQYAQFGDRLRAPHLPPQVGGTQYWWNSLHHTRKVETWSYSSAGRGGGRSGGAGERNALKKPLGLTGRPLQQCTASGFCIWEESDDGVREVCVNQGLDKGNLCMDVNYWSLLAARNFIDRSGTTVIAELLCDESDTKLRNLLQQESEKVAMFGIGMSPFKPAEDKVEELCGPDGTRRGTGRDRPSDSQRGRRGDSRGSWRQNGSRDSNWRTQR